jgi:hypothetical protein
MMMIVGAPDRLVGRAPARRDNIPLANFWNAKGRRSFPSGMDFLAWTSTDGNPNGSLVEAVQVVVAEC